jgi:ATP-dependent DNA helicase RecG
MRSYAGYEKKPELQVTGNAFKITLPNRNVLRHEKINDKVSFNENEEKITALLDKQDEIVRKDVETALGISQAMAVRLLRGLIDKDAIRAIGGGKKTRYRKASKP